MKLPFKIYIQLAIICVIASLGCYLAKFVRFPYDTIIVRNPDTTLHDMIYFEAENFVNFFGIAGFVNLVYFISSLYPNSTTIRFLRYLTLCMCAICFSRCIGDLFTYGIVSLYEIIADGMIILLVLVDVFNKRYKRHIYNASRGCASATGGTLLRN